MSRFELSMLALALAGCTVTVTLDKGGEKDAEQPSWSTGGGTTPLPTDTGRDTSMGPTRPDDTGPPNPDDTSDTGCET